MTHSSVSWQTIIAALLIFIFVGFASSVPVAILATLLAGGAIGSDILILSAVLIGSWLPLKLIIDQQLKGQSMLQLPRRLSPLVVMLSALVYLLLMPVLWMMVLPSFIAGVLVYIIVEGQLLLAVAAGLVVQVISLVRASQREKEMGQAGNFFVQVQSMQDSFNMDTITLTEHDIRRRDRDEAGDTASQDDDPRYLSDGSSDTITISPQTEARKTDDEHN